MSLTSSYFPSALLLLLYFRTRWMRTMFSSVLVSLCAIIASLTFSAFLRLKRM